MRDNLVRLFPEPEAQSSRFEELWKVWPRREGKAIARVKFDGIVRGGFLTKTLDKSSGQFFDMQLSATPDQIIVGAKAYLDTQFDRSTYRYRDSGKFIPHLATWLGRAGWQDFE